MEILFCSKQKSQLKSMTLIGFFEFSIYSQ